MSKFFGERLKLEIYGGSHEKLIEEKGTYYSLYTGAFELD